jgi:hypothetical protein
MNALVRRTVLFAVLASIAPPGLAQERAARPLEPVQLELMLAGNTVHMLVGDQPAMLYFDPRGEVRAIFPTGTRDRGSWSVRAGGTYCVDWDKGPKRSCTTVLWQPGSVRLVDAEGQPRAVITRVAIGEDEALKQS